MTILGRDQAPTGVDSAQFVPIRHFWLVFLPAEINPTAIQGGRKVDQPVLETAERKADTAVEKLLLDEILNRPPAVRKRMLMLLVLLVIRVAALRDQVAPKSVQHGQLVHLPDRHGGAIMPEITVIDMRSQGPEPGQWLSPPLRDALATTFAASEQAMLFLNRRGTVYACANRCPHEGYPLVEGSLDDECILTCNWHNWKFDLDSGATLVGGDTLRRYPVKVDGNDLVLDLSDPPPEVLIEKALTNLQESFPRHEYDRMAREIARLPTSAALGLVS